MKNNLQEEVSQLFSQFTVIRTINGIEYFVGFFYYIGLQTLVGLLAVPRAAVLASQFSHHFDKLFK
jgi:hypothetical protein